MSKLVWWVSLDLMSQELLDLKLGCGRGKHHGLGAYWQKQLYLKKNGNLGTGVLINSQRLSLTWEMPGEKLESPQPCLSPPLNTPCPHKKVIEREEGEKITVSSNLNSSQFYPVYSVLQNVLGYQLSHLCRSNRLTLQHPSIREENKPLRHLKMPSFMFGFFSLIVVFFPVMSDNALLIRVISMHIW